jgi:threonine synthase
MKYISTRGDAPGVDFATACLAGLAPDGGLYVPEAWPQIQAPGPDEPYHSVAARILSAFAGDVIPAVDMEKLCERAYANFSHHSVAPLTQAGSGLWLMELHHGPTLAFKDIAMQIIALLFDYLLGQSGQRMTIICATSGDTGGAAAAAFAGMRYTDLVILHPHERISPVQRLFMTASGAGNITNYAVNGDFDDCQALVKALFDDRDFVGSVNLSGVNSINWARIAAQSVYYASSQAQLGCARVRYVVPSGNMGDALAGYVAGRCGLMNDGFDIVCAVNENDALARLFDSGEMRRTPARVTASPAMDISVPSNFERLLFEVSGRDGASVRRIYDSYRQAGAAMIPADIQGRLRSTGLKANAVSNAETLSEMKRFADETGWLICPHTAVGTFEARRQLRSDVATVVLATAAASKFPETVFEATGRDAPLPERCEALYARKEVFECIDNDLTGLRARLLAGRE